MIPQSSTGVDSISLIDASNSSVWQQEISDGFKTAHELLNYLSIQPENLACEIDDHSPFPTRVPRIFADKMERGQAQDPLLLQVLATTLEREVHVGLTKDPLEEQSFSVLPGLIHKYHNRVLLISHQACAVHCRYCFRRHFPYSDQRLSSDNLRKALAYIEQHTEINEVILSGGDPLSLSDNRLEALLHQIERIPHVSKLRIHSRTAIVLASRLTARLTQCLTQSRLNCVLVVHCNHANELGEELRKPLADLRNGGVHVLNQSVLLAHVNDRADVLVELSNKLFEFGILPYYLHYLDPVQGTHQYNVSIQQAKQLWSDIQKQLSGYLLPRLVQELPGKPSKTWGHSP